MMKEGAIKPGPGKFPVGPVPHSWGGREEEWGLEFTVLCTGLPHLSGPSTIPRHLLSPLGTFSLRQTRATTWSHAHVGSQAGSRSTTWIPRARNTHQNSTKDIRSLEAESEAEPHSAK